MCGDNSVAESCWSSLKRALVHRYRFNTRAQIRPAVYAWIDRDDQIRLHMAQPRNKHLEVTSEPRRGPRRTMGTRADGV